MGELWKLSTVKPCNCGWLQLGGGQGCMETSCTKLAVICFGAGSALFVCWRRIMVWAWMLWSVYALGTRTDILVWPWMHWSPYALGTRTESWFAHGCSGQRMLLKHERNNGLPMDALVTVCSWETNGIMVLAWMLWTTYALGTRTESWFAHGCSGQRMLLEHEPNHGLRMDALVKVCSWNTNGLMVCAWMLWSPYALERERNHGFGMDALVTVCSWNTNGIMVLAWLLWSAYARWNTNGIMSWAWMLWSA